jgi:hypothetical protein
MLKMKSLRALFFIVPAFGLPAIADLLAPTATVAETAITFQSVHVTFPDSDRLFPGPGADPINNNCLSCHSAGMVLNQPAMAKEAWQAEVNKMIDNYKAPVAAEDIPGIVAYLSRTKGLK